MGAFIYYFISVPFISLVAVCTGAAIVLTLGQISHDIKEMAKWKS